VSPAATATAMTKEEHRRRAEELLAKWKGF
jgi:hypothetical protein